MFRKRLKIFKGISKDKLLRKCRKRGLSQLLTERLVMHYVERKTYREIAYIEKINEDSVRKSIVRARNILKK